MLKIFLAPLLVLFLDFAAVAHTDQSNTAADSAAHKADALVIACVDYRFTKHLADVLDEKGLSGKYSLLTMAGASLAASNDFFPSWEDTFWSHLAFLVNLHKIDSVILIDHRDCGMYKFVYGRDLTIDPIDEKNVHQHNLEEIKGKINKKYPELKVELWLLNTKGEIEVIGK